ncbi:MAG TPA: hypothetical protein PK601_07895 [Methanothermobacter sp.]|nr:hypothetical protein [Methanothermobacter sp.]
MRIQATTATTKPKPSVSGAESTPNSSAAASAVETPANPMNFHQLLLFSSSFARLAAHSVWRWLKQ